MELRATLSQALKRDTEDYVSPVLVDGVELPSGLVDPYVGLLRLEDVSPDELAAAVAEKLG